MDPDGMESGAHYERDSQTHDWRQQPTAPLISSYYHFSSVPYHS